jgi:hypothetical protein
MLDDLLAMNEQIKSAPPSPRAFIARFDVPMGRMFKMWDTRGEFVVYVHRGWLMDGVRHTRKGSTLDGSLGIAFGIPVRFEDSAATGEEDRPDV